MNSMKSMSRWVLRAIFIGGLFLLYCPLMALWLDSFREKGWEGQWEWTFRGYRLLWKNQEVLGALLRSIGLAVTSSLISTVIGTMAAFALTKQKKRSSPQWRLFESFFYLPLVLPEIVLGLALLLIFVFFKIPLGFTTVLLAHVTFTLSYVLLAVRSRFQGLDPSLEEAARDLGAGAFATFWQVTFPLLRPGIVSGAVIALMLSLDDFLITFFTLGVQAETLPLLIYSMMKQGNTPEVSALSTLLFVATAGLALGLNLKDR